MRVQAMVTALGADDRAPVDETRLAVSLHFMHYNFGRVHQTLAIKREGESAYQRTPAMTAGVGEYPWSVSQIAGLLD